MRRACLWLAAGAIVFAIYASLLPFALRPQPVGAAWSAFVALLIDPPAERISRTNFLANVLLFVPIGFGLMGARLAGRPRSAAVAGVALSVLTISLAVSVLAEFLQVFVPERIPSRTDIIAQTAGCIVGIAAWSWTGHALTEWLNESAGRHRGDRLSRVLIGYAVLWFLAGLAPFDISVDVGELGHRLRSGMINVVPFGSNVPAPRQAWDAVAGMLGSVPLGMLGLIGWRREPTRRSAGAAWFFGFTAVAALEAAQVFIRSHAADVTDLIFGGLGVAIGVWIGSRTLGRAAAPVDSSPPLARTWALVMAGLWCLVVCGYHWQPFDFGIDLPLVQTKLSGISLIPFASYRSGSDLNAFNNALAKFAVAMPLGVFAAFAIRPVRLPDRAVAALWAAIAACIFAVVEIGQLFVPSRIPDPTDVLLGVVASLAALQLGRWIRDQGHRR